MFTSGCCVALPPHAVLLQDTNLIIKSVDFLEREIEKKILEIDTAESEYRYEEANGFRVQLNQLLKKLRREDANLDNGLLRYQTLVKNEKEKLLSCLGKAEPLFIWRVSTYKGWLSTGESVQA